MAFFWLLKVSLRLDRVRAVASVRTQRGRPPLPVERRPSSLVCALFNPSRLKREERVEASGSRRPGAIRSRGWVVFSEGTSSGANGASIGVAYLCVPTKGPTQVVVETVGAGARKSVCFCDLLRWSVGCHQRLRSRWPYFPPAEGRLASVKSRIAF